MGRAAAVRTVRIWHSSALMRTDGAPHAEVERPEPIPHAPQTGRHADRRDRDEPVELARCGDCAWRRAPAIEEARGRREHVAEAAQSLARGSEEVRTQDRTHRG